MISCINCFNYNDSQILSWQGETMGMYHKIIHCSNLIVPPDGRSDSVKVCVMFQFLNISNQSQLVPGDLDTTKEILRRYKGDTKEI